MKKYCTYIISLIYFLCTGAFAIAQCGVNLLTNGGFDSPAVGSYGNNVVGSSFNGWTFTGNSGNIVKLNGSSYPSGPDVAKNGNQFLDIVTSAGTAYQNFTISGASIPIIFGGYFSSRENSGYVNWTAKIELFAMPSNTLVSTSTTRAFIPSDGNYPAQETWYYMYGSVTLAPGTYRYLATIGDYGNFDAAFVQFDCPVPVVLKSFEGRNINNEVRLKWNIENQSIISHFEVEKSDDAVNFQSIKVILPSTGNSYDFTDKNIASYSVIYYRLKMVGVDNKVTYSNIIHISADKANAFQVRPNYASDNLHLYGMKGKGLIGLFDIYGKKILTKGIKSETLDLNVSSLPPGMYLIQYRDGAIIQTQKFIR